ncbi:oxidoreductase [Microbacterium horticulturae]|uniref:Oxidoreductase n=1 Tax=Microbacterium horticulturae TaxID=3028316 RepID=A0ABY8C4Q7_9MICO|nr:oxidoreductase [Microbacterium sp. KACC 23027]WEG09823.1 oxidoreductase [Microbacterium sp. KACC 23027]
MPTSLPSLTLPNLSARTAVITGASAGIGLATARALAAAGCHVVLAVRDVSKGEDAASRIAGSTEVRRLDLADLSAVHSFVSQWGSRNIDLLINNAYAASPALQHTADGFELQFGTGHLGHFALTVLLLPHITGRVVTVSSQAERSGRFIWNDLAWAHGGYTSARAYSRTKLAGLLFMSELQRRLEAAGSSVRALAAHPGFIATDIYSEAGAATRLLVRTLAQTPERGALPVLHAALADVPGDSFIGPSRWARMRGAPAPIPRSAQADNSDLAARLWAVSEELTGVAWTAVMPTERHAR